MGRIYFTDEQLKDLSVNPFVKKASNKAITYTDEFKEYYVSEYNTGKMPLEILRNAGFDVKALGKQRVDNLSRRFLSMGKRQEGFSDLRKETSGRLATKHLTPDEQITRLKHQVRYLKQENEFLKKMNFINREAQWKFKLKQKKNSK
ncbi:hypothetical protein H7E67_20210 [Clostridium gasigenes]|uniref:HTH domain-containing protein n=1 Tax=Clostridium gasigenes TaxID=94869 RepID=UPI00143826EF|nr:HTH domain-containing protein [Clostridium gasigenes]MBB6625686.1 hypothetical protein [Clostridium gasigenes]MBU3090465.1 hypothetical protein [Clostridium gasigenes]NKF08887.1 hypothetical protein [Clostridium gasigenes]QSW18105.1 hypothetical protein J1C67_11040 [Clostridium gasigenes]QSW18442.1 hypothetical protein J1C67_12885 [Clostridium gasigenes]